MIFFPCMAKCLPPELAFEGTFPALDSKKIPTDPRCPKIQIWKDFLHKRVVEGLGYVPGVCWSFLRLIVFCSPLILPTKEISRRIDWDDPISCQKTLAESETACIKQQQIKRFPGLLYLFTSLKKRSLLYRGSFSQKGKISVIFLRGRHAEMFRVCTRWAPRSYK